MRLHLPHGFRTTGLVEVTLDNGVTGLGEGYLATFAPTVFVEIVRLIEPHLIGKDISDLGRRYREMCRICDYWSLQGAARHAISALETAFLDAASKNAGVPAYTFLGGKLVDAIKLYGSGGDSMHPRAMQDELDLLEQKSITLFKIRTPNHFDAKAVWTMRAAAQRSISVGIDMVQNLANPSQTVGDVVRFVRSVEARSGARIEFLEEVLGPFDANSYPLLRAKLDTIIAGGETMTTAHELCQRIEAKFYDWVQPDATVIGGVNQVLEVFDICRRKGSQVVVHCWGSAVCLMANYHAAFVGGGLVAEWPMPFFPLREELLEEPLQIRDGCLQPPVSPGLGVRLTHEVEQKYPFRPEAVYQCFPAHEGVPVYSGETWQ